MPGKRKARKRYHHSVIFLILVPSGRDKRKVHLIMSIYLHTRTLPAHQIFRLNVHIISPLILFGSTNCYRWSLYRIACSRTIECVIVYLRGNSKHRLGSADYGIACTVSTTSFRIRTYKQMCAVCTLE